MIRRKLFAIACAAALCVGAASADAQKKPSAKKTLKKAKIVGLVCTWSAYGVNKETIIVDTVNKGAYWVNENQNLKVLQFNPGRVVMAGVRARLQVSQSQVEKKVPMRMTINRISGEFIVGQKVHPYQGPGSCRKQRLF